LSEESYKDSTLIMQLLRDNLVSWSKTQNFLQNETDVVMQTLWTSSEAEPQEPAGQSAEVPKEGEAAPAPETTTEKTE